MNKIAYKRMISMKLHRLLKIAAMVFAMSILWLSVCMAAVNPVRILCYGDSNTWGWMPQENGVPTMRYSAAVRWTGVLQEKLGQGYTVIEEGLNGRTAGVDLFDGELKGELSHALNLNGKPTLLPILKSQSPVNIIVMMLGSNDMMPSLKQDTAAIARSMDQLIALIQDSGLLRYELGAPQPKILVVAPVPIRTGNSALFNRLYGSWGIQTSQELGEAYAAVAKRRQVEFLDASKVVSVADGIDGVHLTPEAHRLMAEAIFLKIKSMQ